MKVYRYILNKREKTINLPVGFKVLDSQYSRGDVSLWILQDTSDTINTKEVKFLQIHTNEEVPTGAVYVSTVQMPEQEDENGKIFAFVYHIFYI